jgi:citrate lyase subunit gamma (acyl carrier protein)
MEISTASAGTLESGDILVEITPARQKGIEIMLNSTVSHQFGKQIKQVISQTLSELNITDATVHATDKGALDCTIRARVAAAACRATKTEYLFDKRSCND